MTIEKILVVLVLAAVIVGPHRLPGYAHRLAAFVRGIRAYTDAARSRLETEVGAPLAVDEWRSLDPRQYDPRRIVREALAGPRPVAGAAAQTLDPLPDAVPEGSHDEATPEPIDSAAPAHAVPANTPRTGGSGLADLMARGVAARAAAARVEEAASEVPVAAPEAPTGEGPASEESAATLDRPVVLV